MENIFVNILRKEDWIKVSRGIKIQYSLGYQVILVLIVAIINTVIRKVTQDYTIPLTDGSDLFLFSFITYFCYAALILVSILFGCVFEKSIKKEEYQKFIQIGVYSSIIYYLMLIINTLINFYNIAGVIGQFLFVISIYHGIRSVFQMGKLEAIRICIRFFISFSVLFFFLSFFILNQILIQMV